MRPRVKPALRRILRDERTLQFGVHPRRAVLVSELAPSVRQWIDRLDGTREIAQVMREASGAGLSEDGARSLLDTLTARGVLDDAAVRPATLARLSLAERDRLRPELDALDLASTIPGGGLETMRRRREARVRVYGAGRVGAQVVALLAASGVGQVRVVDPAPARAEDLVPGGLGWAELGAPREEGAVAVARRITAGGSGLSATGDRSGGCSEVSGDPAPPPSGRASGRGAGAASDRASGAASGRASGAASARRRRETWPAVDGGPSVEAVAGAPHLCDGSQRPDLVVLAPVGPLDAILVSELVTMRIPHLLVAAFEGHGSVGPLVRPGETACLHCLDLARRDRDPAWPIVTAHLGGFPVGEIACGSALATLVAAAATGHALAHIDGQESAVTNGTMDVMPDWHWKRRSWTMHPQCRCWRKEFSALTMVRPGSCS
ncbi:thiamine biosynthesis protein ThiF [Nonomuraea dietziae]|uniref:thiamine biosynthesis protein ThiF n=1 Tax=Nonomuraea dietziae TaxID=65515 RepID=UPI0034426F99